MRNKLDFSVHIFSATTGDKPVQVFSRMCFLPGGSFGTEFGIIQMRGIFSNQQELFAQECSLCDTMQVTNARDLFKLPGKQDPWNEYVSDY